jgi:hypothetical protein
MKIGRNFLKDFFVKEPKFSVVIALMAIIMLIVLFLNFDFSTVYPFSSASMKMGNPMIEIPRMKIPEIVFPKMEIGSIFSSM